MTEQNLDRFLSLADQLRPYEIIDYNTFDCYSLSLHKMYMVIYHRIFKELGLPYDEKRLFVLDMKEVYYDEAIEAMDIVYSGMEELYILFGWSCVRFFDYKDRLLLPRGVRKRFHEEIRNCFYYDNEQLYEDRTLDCNVHYNKQLGKYFDLVKKNPILKENKYHRHIIDLTEYAKLPYFIWLIDMKAESVENATFYSIYATGYTEDGYSFIDYSSFRPYSILCACLLQEVLNRALDESIDKGGRSNERRLAEVW